MQAFYNTGSDFHMEKTVWQIFFVKCSISKYLKMKSTGYLGKPYTARPKPGEDMSFIRRLLKA